MREVELPGTTLPELITYAKQKRSPVVTIIDGVKAADIDEIMTVAKRLQLVLFAVGEETDFCSKVAILENRGAAKHLAKSLEKRCQTMYYDFEERPAGSITIAALAGFPPEMMRTIRDNGFKASAYDAEGNKIPTFIETDGEEVDCSRLADLRLAAHKFYLSIGNAGALYHDRIMNLSRYYYRNDGVFNETRQCYYPGGASHEEVADMNRLEKWFQKWGYKSLKTHPDDSGYRLDMSQERKGISVCSECTDRTRCTGCGQSALDRMKDAKPVASPIRKEPIAEIPPSEYPPLGKRVVSGELAPLQGSSEMLKGKPDEST